MFLWVIPKRYFFKIRVLCCCDTLLEFPKSYYPLKINRCCSDTKIVFLQKPCSGLLLFLNGITIVALPFQKKNSSCCGNTKSALLSNPCFRDKNESMFLCVIPKRYYFKTRVLCCCNSKIVLPKSYYGKKQSLLQ